MEQVVQESLERRMRAAKHLLLTSSLEGLIDVDNILEEALVEYIFELDEQTIMFGILKTILGVKSEVKLSDIIYSLSTIDRQSAIQALNMAYSIDEVSL